MAAGVAAACVAGAATTTQAAADVAPPCKITDFTTSLGPVQAGAGQRYSTLDFTAYGGRTCVLSDDLTNFQFLGAQGRPLPTDADAPGSSTSITIAPGVVGHLDLHWTVVGGTPFVPVSLIFTMPADDGTNAAPWTGGPVNGTGRIDVGPLHA
ncbi:DUF4232 domain-containing protein [Actinoallomurus sp. NBC_01490]|jgi:hypothetical protein|uniref:DUF4232 domain-containing protein n=1 Tax=Actinoallomurus sp. NBC_01490 TaxID=2903557 RepID=UPI002E3102E7|nr:DUF4232 domain-containing protein [Actinoallomurus sp. NBC_01490]